MPKLEITCFGHPAVLVGGGTPNSDVLWRKHVALLAYLALSESQSRSRDHLLGLLWPEKEEAKARHSLNEAVRRLRVGLGEHRVQTVGDVIRLNVESLDVDVWKFESLLEHDPGEAAKMVIGQFFEGFVLDDAPAFDEWAANQRARLSALAVSALLEAGEKALSENRVLDAEQLGRKAGELNALSEPVAHFRIRCRALAGDATGALAVFDEFRTRVMAEIGENPGKELVALAERVRTNSWQVTSSPRSIPVQTPLVGRANAHRAAFDAVANAVGSSGRCLVIVGESGMGKTRLIGECLSRAALYGAVAVRARPLESDPDAPWSTLRMLDRAGLRELPGAIAIEPTRLSVLASVMSEGMGTRGAGGSPEVGEVASALAVLFSSIADEQPLAIAIDDAQFADRLTVAALREAMTTLRTARVFLVLALDPSLPEPARELVALRQDLSRGVPGVSVQLRAFDADEMRELAEAAATWCKSEGDRQRLAKRLQHESGGSPLFAATLLTALESGSSIRVDMLDWPEEGGTLDSPLPMSVPDLVKVAVLARASGLDQAVMDVLAVASVFGSYLDPEVIGTVAGVSASDVDRAFETLEERGLLRYDGGRYSFAAALFPQAILSEKVRPGRRNRIRRSAIEALAGRPELDAQLLRIEFQLDTGDDDVFEAAVDVARRAIEQGSIRTARRALTFSRRASNVSHKTLDGLIRTLDN